MTTLTTSRRSFTIPSSSTGSVWTRVELSVRATSLEPGLQARLADPLWLLHRQWQIGEFAGEDAASPVEVELQYGSTELSAYHHRADASGTVDARPYPSRVPLETVVERQPALNGASAWGLAAEAGLHALRLLDAHGVGAHRGKLRDEHRLGPLPEHDPLLQAADHQRARVLRRSALDARKLVTRLRGSTGSAVAAALGLPLSDHAAVGAALDGWLVWYRERLSTTIADQQSWLPERMEHGFQISAPTPQARVTLAADEYPGGHLDWWAFDVRGDVTHQGARNNERHQHGTVRTLPTPLRYQGMPADRFWEREEGSVWFGGLEGGPADLARLVVAEFATIYGDDWFLVPLGVDEGSLVRVTRVRVSDCFGRTEQIASAAQLDGPDRVFRMFELDGDAGPDGPASESTAPWLLVAPSLAQVDQGRVVERVVLGRDEGANLAWAIEQQVENALGRVVARREAWLERAAELGDEPSTDARDRDWRYRLQTSVPPHWIPLVPTRIAGSKEVNLRRGVMQQWEDLPASLGAGPRGDMLEPGQVLRLREEQLPREGLELTRRWQLTRDSEGRLHLWLGRRKRVGHGERSSALSFDIIER